MIKQFNDGKYSLQNWGHKDKRKNKFTDLEKSALGRISKYYDLIFWYSIKYSSIQLIRPTSYIHKSTSNVKCHDSAVNPNAMIAIY